jgi:hypothetical protein
MTEGVIEWEAGATWYRVVGDLGAGDPAPLAGRTPADIRAARRGPDRLSHDERPDRFLELVETFLAAHD